MKPKLIIPLFAAVTPLLLPQTSEPAAIQFDAATIKPMLRNANGGFAPPHMSGGPGTSDPGRMAWVNYDLRYLLLTAFDLKPYQLLAPDWFPHAQFVIEAAVPVGTTREQANQMLRNLLVDRFQMALHQETRDVPLYELTLLKKGPNLRKSRSSEEDDASPLPQAPGFNAYGLLQEKDGFVRLPLNSPPMLPGTAFPMPSGPGAAGGNQPIAALALFLSARLGRPVIDKTGLTGNWDYNLEFAPKPGDSQSGSMPDLVAAVQEQLGLKLESRRGLVSLLFIDRVEKTPSGN